jgi:two-component system response regulator PhoP
LEAVLRRSGGYASSTITRGPITFDLQSGDLQINGQPIKLTTLELKVLQYFLLNPRKIVSKMALADYIYDEQNDKDSNVIEVIIARLRHKLDPDNEYKPIETLRGRGYILRRDMN